MGEHQFVVSIDKTYKSLAKDIVEADETYRNPKTKGPNYKKLCQDGIKLIHLFKTCKMQLVLALGCDKQFEEEIEIVRELLSGKR